ncbi:hypothetical protein [Streptomyces sp. AC555_RSS877]|uniref:hypothetical protein n=1 Tax=Streptomyces sp. AC555_RSS877 TaxID=2823688 RepID=UPI001C268E8F|nr:hypothetical protein [Streptomyces sp. AC555_RSS877]
MLMLIDFLPMLFLLAVILLLGAWLLGGRITYDVLLSNTPPYDQDVRNPEMGWVVWITGWLVVPAFIGALAGEAVGYVMERRMTGITVRQAAEAIKEELGIAASQQPPGPGGTPGAGQ